MSTYTSDHRITPRIPGRRDTAHMAKHHLEALLPLNEYDTIIVLFSGGKDSLAALLYLLELGVPKEKIELFHHDIDGGHPTRKMDWPVTQAYVKAVAEHFGIALRPSWRVNGFFGEVYRVGASWPIQYIDPYTGELHQCRLSEKQIRSMVLREKILTGAEQAELEAMGHRMQFPAKTADLATRWCSSVLKIDPCSKTIRDVDWEELKAMGLERRLPAKGGILQGRWCSPTLKREPGDALLRDVAWQELVDLGYRLNLPAKGSCQQGRYCSGTLKAEVEGKVERDIKQMAGNVNLLVVSGERREESPNRAKYNEMEIHPANATAKARRLVHHWRPVIDWSEEQIWQIIEQYQITPHPCYTAGWNRCSCALCIFSLPTHWAGIRELFPKRFAEFEEDERILGRTLNHKTIKRKGKEKEVVRIPLAEFVGDAPSCVYHDDPKAIRQLKTGQFSTKDIVSDNWLLPAGAFHGTAGGPC